MSDNTKRPDPLQLALTAIGDYERAVANVEAAEMLPDLNTLHQRAQLRALYAIAEELRLLRRDSGQGLRNVLGGLDTLESSVLLVEATIREGRDAH